MRVVFILYSNLPLFFLCEHAQYDPPQVQSGVLAFGKSSYLSKKPVKSDQALLCVGRLPAVLLKSMTSCHNLFSSAAKICSLLVEKADFTCVWS